ncbi:MAG: hypothetical protein HQL52_14670 [Magnetococcales bacterium]|nr:hypothetical protein [Magnetococcales bacterium]
MKINGWFGKRLASLLLVAGMIGINLAEGASLYRRGCEYPAEGLQVCWEASAEEGSAFGPFAEVHLLPVTQQRAGLDEVLVNYTLGIQRQLMPGNFARVVIQESTPARHLGEAINLSRRNNWSTVMYISPRVLRNSSAMSPGMVDWDVYFIDGLQGRVIRTLRLQVESTPYRKPDAVEIGAMTAGGVVASGVASASPVGAAGLLATALAARTPNPPEAGRSLEYMTELAVRQILFLAQYPIEELSPPDSPVPDAPKPSVTEQAGGWLARLFSTK